jgi:hypothetical protein
LDSFLPGKLRISFLAVNRTHTECEHTYNKRSLAGGGDIPSVGGANREEELQKLVDRKLQDMQNSRLKITVSGKEVVVKEKVSKIVHGILSAKRFIGSAVSAEPHAALAWAGVLIVLPVSIYIDYLSTLYY